MDSRSSSSPASTAPGLLGCFDSEFLSLFSSFVASRFQDSLPNQLLHWT